MARHLPRPVHAKAHVRGPEGRDLDARAAQPRHPGRVRPQAGPARPAKRKHRYPGRQHARAAGRIELQPLRVEPGPAPAGPQRDPGVPEPLDELVLWATEREPDERPVDAKAMLDRLREIEKQLGVFPQVVRTAAVGTGVIAVDDGVDSGELTKVLPGTFTAPTVTPAADNATRLRARTRRSAIKGGWLLLLVLLLATAAGGAGWWFGSGPGSLIAVPSISGGTYEEAAAELSALSLQAAPGEDYSLEVPQGEVIGTDPGAGTRVEKDSSVEVIVSLGPASADLPKMQGMTEDEATQALADVNIEVVDRPTYFTDFDAGIVVRVYVTQAEGEEPVQCTEGCTVLQGSTAQLRLSLGPVPDVVGESVDSATSTLEGVDLVVATTEEYSSEVEQGRVIRMLERDGGGNFRPGETVTLVISKGPQPIAITDVTGWTIREAVGELQALSFNVNAGISDEPLPLGGGYWDAYCVNGYDPSGSALPGATVTLTPVLCILQG